MRSVVVVLPASICAAMPMFLILSSGTVRAIKIPKLLPSVMRERLVRFRHAVYVVPLLDGAAPHVRGVIQLVGQLFRHSLFGPGPGVQNDPADSEAGTPYLRHFDGHLIVGAAHPPRLHFEQWLGILHGLLEQLQR